MFYKTTKLLFKSLIVTLILGQLSRVPFGNEGAIYLSDLVIVLLSITWLFWRLIEAKSLKFNSIDLLLILFMGITLISLIASLSWVSKTQFLVGGFYWIRTVMYMSLFKVTHDLLVFRKSNQIDISSWIEYTGIVFAALGLVQFLFFPDFSKYILHGWDPHYYRVLSTYFDPNYAGLLLGFVFIFVLWLVYEKKGSFKLHLFSLVLIGLSFLLTYSRSSYLSLGIGLALFSWFKDRRIIIAMLALSVIAFISVPRFQERVIGAVQIDETAQLRLEDYRKTWNIIQDNVILGVGYNVFRYAQDRYGYFRNERGINQPGGHAGAGADNSLLFIWASGGIMSFLSIIAFFIGIIVRSWRKTDRYVILALTGCFVIHFQFVNSLFLTWLLAWFVIVVSWLIHRKGEYAE